MNSEKPISYEVEGLTYKSTPATEQSIFRLLRKLHDPESIVIVREWDGSVLDELKLNELI
jgi:hypothetical protein